MIKIPNVILCPWCQKILKNYDVDPVQRYNCMCNELYESKNEFKKISFIMEIIFNVALPKPVNTYVDNFGIFFNMSEDSYLSCDYNVGEISPYNITLCSYTGSNITLSSDPKILGEDLNEITINGAALLRRYHKLLVFS